MKKIWLPLLGLLLTITLLAQAPGVRAKLSSAFASATDGTAAATSAAAAADPSPIDGGVAAEGRLVTYPGGEVVVSTDLAGTIVRLPVEEKALVKKGQVIAELRGDDLRAELAEARAKVNEAEADTRYADIDMQRAERLLEAQVGTQAALDRAKSTRDAAAARGETVKAEVHRLEAVLAKARITAPIDGVVITRSVHPGEHVEAGVPLLTIANLGHTRIEAEVDEFDAGRVGLGSKVRVTAEGYDGRFWPARVEEIPDSVVARRLKPQDPGRPSDTRVLLVKIALEGNTPLKLGQRVEVSIAPPPEGEEVAEKVDRKAK